MLSKYWLCIDVKYLQFLIILSFGCSQKPFFHVHCGTFFFLFLGLRLTTSFELISPFVCLCMCAYVYACTTHVCACI
jgi:hypothetical protein